MGKRDRLKKGIRSLLGRSEDTASPPTPKQTFTPPPAPQPTPPVVMPPPAPAPTPTPTPTPEPPTAVEEDPEAAKMAEKAAKHFEKTRVAMLKFIVDQGGEASMADMHAHSERRYFIAHKRFSDLMEGIVDEGLIDFDHDTGMAIIKTTGQSYIDG
jgi:hypothetical protein